MCNIWPVVGFNACFGIGFEHGWLGNVGKMAKLGLQWYHLEPVSWGFKVVQVCTMHGQEIPPPPFPNLKIYLSLSLKRYFNFKIGGGYLLAVVPWPLGMERFLVPSEWHGSWYMTTWRHNEFLGKRTIKCLTREVRERSGVFILSVIKTSANCWWCTDEIKLVTHDRPILSLWQPIPRKGWFTLGHEVIRLRVNCVRVRCYESKRRKWTFDIYLSGIHSISPVAYLSGWMNYVLPLGPLWTNWYCPFH